VQALSAALLRLFFASRLCRHQSPAPGRRRSPQILLLLLLRPRQSPRRAARHLETHRLTILHGGTLVGDSVLHSSNSHRAVVLAVQLLPLSQQQAQRSPACHNNSAASSVA
jgi:hypothetical protein